MENVSVSFVCDLPKKGNSPKVLITNDINKKYKIEFIDTLTKFPTPNKLNVMIEKKEVEFTPEQITAYKEIFDKLFTSI